jgi:ABC-type nitrate/sulfonate/bicarbonate transport system substrate-binding protein
MLKKGLLMIPVLLSLMFGSGIPVHSQTLKTVRVMTPVLESSVLYMEAASRFGFYEQEGLKLELVRATLPTSVQAILGGSGDYCVHGGAVGAILGGVPFKVLAVNTDKSPQYIVARTEITSLKELVGKTMAIDDIGGAADWAARETLARNGIPPDKISFRRIGTPPLRFQALVAGAVDAAPLNFMFAGRAREKNLRILVYSGDFLTDIQLTAAAPVEKIQKSPEEIYKFLKATLKGRYFEFGNPDEGYKLFLELEGLSDSKFARDGWEERRMRSSKEARIGLLSEETAMQSIHEWKGQMKLGGRPLKIEGRPDEVFDFSFAKRANEEIKAEGFDPRRYHYSGKK